MSDPKVMIGRFADPVGYANSRNNIGADWTSHQISDVSFLGHIGRFPDERRDALGEDFEGDRHPTPEEIGEEPTTVVVKPCAQLEPDGPTPF